MIVVLWYIIFVLNVISAWVYHDALSYAFACIFGFLIGARWILTHKGRSRDGAG